MFKTEKETSEFFDCLLSLMQWAWQYEGVLTPNLKSLLLQFIFELKDEYEESEENEP